MNCSAHQSTRLLASRAAGVMAVFAAALSLGASGTAGDRTPGGPAEDASFTAGIPKSVFVDEPTVGRDPFYPASTRRIPVARITKSTVKAPDANRVQLLTLKGITGPSERRLALINNLTFVAGETGNVRVGGGYIKIRVLEVGEKTVTIAVEGEPGRHELKLHDLAGTPLATGN